MDADDETNELLREIRDLLADRDRKYDSYLEENRRLYEHAQRQHARRTTIALVALLAIVALIFLPRLMQ